MGERSRRGYAERVSSEPGKHVHVHMEDLLEGGPTVGQEEVDALTPDPRGADGRSRSMGEVPYALPVFRGRRVAEVLLSNTFDAREALEPCGLTCPCSQG